ncbi:MAG: glycosyltransferase, partial [Candidatus Electrothrix sp. AR3]|nr:glycosyltransferase [Candidatus Electrothrix sp. AR3]
SNFFKNTETELRIGGIGQLKEELIAFALSKGVKNQVQFLGMLSREQVKQEMTDADCFVLSSRYETFGVVLIEALSCGTPVVATCCGGPEDIVNEGNGLLVPVAQPDKLAEAMHTVYKNTNNYDSGKIAKDCFERFGTDAFVQNATRLYKKILEGV